MTCLEGGRRSPGPTSGIFTMDRVAAIEKVARKSGLPFQRLAKPGENYPDGSKRRVPENYAYISIGDGTVKDMGRFWEEVEELSLVMLRKKFNPKACNFL